VLVVLISGPIASGKSALSRVVAAQLEDAYGVASCVVDLDLVYEMLHPRRGPKDDDHLWTEARRIAGRLGSALLREGRSVIAEGDFATDDALREFGSELPKEAVIRLVLLSVDFETALERARADPSRGVSRNRAFLSAHFDAFEAEWLGRDVLHLDTSTGSLAETARAVTEWLALAR
jgi:hypothetical protein